jgi:hypothetical protein
MRRWIQKQTWPCVLHNLGILVEFGLNMFHTISNTL